MTQRGVVIKINGENAEVQVLRTSMCGDSCAGCKGGCTPSTQTVYAVNETQAFLHIGDVVTLETETDKVLGATAAVYLWPLIGLFLGFFLAQRFSKSELLCAFCALLGCGLCFILLRFWDKYTKKKRNLLVRITDILVRKGE